MLANINYKRKLVYLILFFSMLCFYFVSDAFSQMSDSRAQTEVGELNNKVEEAYQAGKYEEGLKLAIEAYDYAKKNLGKTHPDTLTSLNNLAGLYQAQGRYSEAEPLYKEALASTEKVLGKT
ncbi:MAG: tetratricopeptide repeat protein, partial [Candidatus Magnetoovum sp. WYHC-5]|nr:tetratricopeptide repeat protein [Candidatus Magnetoovum sp. WYHC-5]